MIKGKPFFAEQNIQPNVKCVQKSQVYCYFKYMYMNFLGEEDQTCYDISRLRKPDSTFDRGYYYSSLSTKYEKGSLK